MAMDQGQLDLAIDGFESNRKLINSKTKLYLETTALLAITHLRKQNIAEAKPYIKKVLQSSDIIKTEATKIKFNEEVINRFDEEYVQAAIRTDRPSQLNLEPLEKEVDMALQLTNEQLFTMLGRVAPKHLKDILFEVDKFAKNQLTYKEQKLLPSSEELVSDENTEKVIFSSLNALFIILFAQKIVKCIKCYLRMACQRLTVRGQ